jgi:hypothetical protein
MCCTATALPCMRVHEGVPSAGGRVASCRNGRAPAARRDLHKAMLQRSRPTCRGARSLSSPSFGAIADSCIRPCSIPHCPARRDVLPTSNTVGNAASPNSPAGIAATHATPGAGPDAAAFPLRGRVAMTIRTDSPGDAPPKTHPDRTAGQQHHAHLARIASRCTCVPALCCRSPKSLAPYNAAASDVSPARVLVSGAILPPPVHRRGCIGSLADTKYAR